MTDAFGLDLAADMVADWPNWPAATFETMVPGTRTPGSLTGGTNPTSPDTPCKACVLDYTSREMSGTNVEVNDRKILIIAKTLSKGTVTPTAGDRITIEGRVYQITDNVGAVKRDPSGALFIVQGRGSAA